MRWCRMMPGAKVYQLPTNPTAENMAEFLLRFVCRAVLRHQLILVIGLVMVTCLPGEAQTPAKQIFLAQTRPSPMMAFFR